MSRQAAPSRAPVVAYDVNALAVSPLSEKAYNAMTSSQGMVPSQQDFLDAVAVVLGKRKVKNTVNFLPRAEVLAQISATLRMEQTVQPPAGFPSDAAQWKFRCKDNYWAKDAQCSVLYTTSHQAGSNACLTPLEDAYNILLAAHVDPNGAKHRGRDATFVQVKEVSESITKELVVEFLARCPHQRCTKAGSVGKDSGVKRENMARQRRADNPKERQTVEEKKAVAAASRVSKKGRREACSRETEKAVQRVLVEQPQALQMGVEPVLAEQPQAPQMGYQLVLDEQYPALQMGYQPGLAEQYPALQMGVQPFLAEQYPALQMGVQPTPPLSSPVDGAENPEAALETALQASLQAFLQNPQQRRSLKSPPLSDQGGAAPAPLAVPTFGPVQGVQVPAPPPQLQVAGYQYQYQDQYPEPAFWPVQGVVQAPEPQAQVTWNQHHEPSPAPVAQDNSYDGSSEGGATGGSVDSVDEFFNMPAYLQGK